MDSHPPQRPRIDPAVLRELAGLLCLLLGVGGLVTIAFLLHPYAGVGVLSCAFVAAGLRLTMSEVDE